MKKHLFSTPQTQSHYQQWRDDDDQIWDLIKKFPDVDSLASKLLEITTQRSEEFFDSSESAFNLPSDSAYIEFMRSAADDAIESICWDEIAAAFLNIQHGDGSSQPKNWIERWLAEECRPLSWLARQMGIPYSTLRYKIHGVSDSYLLETLTHGQWVQIEKITSETK